MLSALLAAAAIIAAAFVVGGLVSWLCRAPAWTWTSAATGFSLLMVVTAPAAALPGRMLIPLVLVAALLVAGIAVLLREQDLRPPATGLLVIVPTAVVACFPFLANGRVGLPGVSFNNDTAAHLWLAEGMHSAVVRAVTPLLEYYPLGPHGVVGALASLGMPADLALTGLIVAVPVLTAATAQAFLPSTPWPLRIPVVLLTALPFLGASYVAQGAFKETIMVLLLVGFAASIQDASTRTDPFRYLPSAVVLAGIISAYSYVGLVWPLAGLGLIGISWLIRRWREGGRSAVTRGAVALIAPVLGAFLLTLVLLIPQLRRIQAFLEWNRTFGIKANDIGNLAGPISPKEMLGIWWTGDFRFAPADLTITHVGGLVVAALLIGAAGWWLWRGLTALPLVALGALVIATVLLENQSPYTVAKAYVIVSPFTFLLIGRAVTEGGLELPRVPRALLLSASAGVCGLALWSTGLALRSAQVGARDHAADLASLRPLLDGKPTLYLGLNDYLTWELRGVPATQPFYGYAAFAPRPEKGWAYGQSFDADSVPAKTLDTFAYVITPRVTSDSELPENFEKVTSRGVYDLYRRTGPTPERSVLAEGQDGGAVLDCATPEGRALSRQTGVAAVRAPQVRIPLSAIPPRSEARPTIQLPPGTWDLSIRYASSRPIRLTGPGLNVRLPAAQERVGSIWPAGTLTVRKAGDVPLRLKPEYRPFSVDAATPVLPTELIAQARGGQRLVPLRQACSRFVDWYRLTPLTEAGTTKGRHHDGQPTRKP